MRVIVYGSRPDGHARVVIELLAAQPKFEVLGLVDDHAENRNREVCGLRMLGTKRDLGALADAGAEGALLGFGAAQGRVAVMAEIEAAGLALPRLRHSSSQVAASAELGSGSQLLPGSIVGPGAAVGRGALVNSGAIVEHDVRIDAGAVVDPGAVLTGRCHIGTETEIGAAAVVLPDVVVGPRATVGAGAVVTGPVHAETVVAGVPARRLDRTPAPP